MPAHAQEGSRFWILRQLFQPRERFERREMRPQQEFYRPPKPKPRKKRKAAPAAVAAPAEPAAVEKAPDARTLLVIGDFLGSGLAESLTDLFAQNPAIRVVDKTSGSSGIVRTDVVDWPNSIGKLIEKEKPVAVIAMIGANDRQPMQLGDKREPPLGPVWTDAYEKRADALGTAVAASKLPLLWVGLPAFKSSKANPDLIAFNDLFRAAVESTGGEFVDVWDGFVDENGAFVSTGPDINGQPVRLRTNDGINLTRAGKRKLAFYLEKPLSKILGIPVGSGAVAVLPKDDTGVLPVSLPSGPAAPVDRTQPMALGENAATGENELLGASRTKAPNAAAAVTPAVAGRADDFTARP